MKTAATILLALFATSWMWAQDEPPPQPKPKLAPQTQPATPPKAAAKKPSSTTAPDQAAPQPVSGPSLGETMAFIVSQLDGNVLSATVPEGQGSEFVTLRFSNVQASGCTLSYTKEWDYQTDLLKYSDTGEPTPKDKKQIFRRSLNLASGVTNLDEPATVDNADAGLFEGHDPLNFYSVQFTFQEPQSSDDESVQEERNGSVPPRAGPTRTKKLPSKPGIKRVGQSCAMLSITPSSYAAEST